MYCVKLESAAAPERGYLLKTLVCFLKLTIMNLLALLCREPGRFSLSNLTSKAGTRHLMS